MAAALIADAGRATHGLCIVVPVLDEAPRIGSLLARLQPMRERGVRIVVADGGSRDASAEIARAGADRVLVAPRGRASQMNAGAACCTAAIVLFLHADTVLPEDGDRHVLEAVARGARWGRFDVRIDDRRAVFRVVESMMNLRSRLTGVATGDQAIFVRRDLFESVGGYPAIALMEDVALAKALRRHGRCACLRARVVTSARRWNRHGVWRTIALMWWLRAAYFLGADPSRLAARYASDQGDR
ncbi:MAG: TIGR04283 family arsenosugar biosynthesis glycosyltransferase [Burkholderiales bacterium]